MPTNLKKKSAQRRSCGKFLKHVQWWRGLDRAANKLSFAISARGRLLCSFALLLLYFLLLPTLDVSALSLCSRHISSYMACSVSLVYTDDLISSDRMGEFPDLAFRVNKLAVVAWFDSSTMRTRIVPANIGICLHFGPICECLTQLLHDAFPRNGLFVSYSFLFIVIYYIYVIYIIYNSDIWMPSSGLARSRYIIFESLGHDR